MCGNTKSEESATLLQLQECYCERAVVYKEIYKHRGVRLYYYCV